MAEATGQLDEQHQNPPEGSEMAKPTYDQQLKEPETGDLTEYPDLWDQASDEYKAEARVNIIKAVLDGNYDLAEELIRGIRFHGDGIENYKDKKDDPFKTETRPLNINEVSIKNETRKEILRIFHESDWLNAKDHITAKLNSSKWDSHILGEAAEMRNFDPERFDHEIEIAGHPWDKLSLSVQNEEEHTRNYLLSASKLKAVSPKLFEKGFWNSKENVQKEKDWQRIMEVINKSKNNPRGFLFLVDAVKYIDEARFKQQIGASEEFNSVIWPEIVKYVEKMEEGPVDDFVIAAGTAQKIKPENQPDITIKEKTWNTVKKELELNLHERLFGKFFLIANNASCLRVENQ